MADTTQQNNSEQVSNSYLIKKGDTLSAIAKTQGTTIAEIMKLNPSITNPNLIYAGKSLTLSEANDVINQNQEADIANAEKSSEPPVKSGYDSNGELSVGVSATPKTTIEDIKSTITPTTEKPTMVSMVDTYGNLRTQYGVSNLETQLNDLNAQLAEVQATKKARIASEKGKSVAMNVITGRISEVEAQENERIAALENSITNVSNQLNTKYNIINTMMTLTEKDYDNAVASYDKEMSNNISMYNILRGINDDEKTEEQRKVDNARSSAQIIYNQIAAGGVNLSELPDTTKTLITKLEVQAGLPAGFYSSMQNKNPKAEVVATYNWTGTDNKEYASVITKDAETGELKTSNIVLGVGKKTGSTTDPEEEQQKTIDAFYKDLKENREYLTGYGKDRSLAKNTREWLRDLLIRKYPQLTEQSIQDEVYAYYPDL